jgi:hypothetical protein
MEAGQIPPIPPPPASRRGIRVFAASRWGFLVVGLVVGLALGAAAGASTKTETAAPEAVSSNPSATTAPSLASSPSPSPPPVVKGTWRMTSCDLNLGSASSNTLIGSVKVENTGTVEAEITVSFEWQLGDGSRLDAPSKTLTLLPGRDRLVFFKKVVGIDTALNFQSHPGYSDSSNCKAKATISEA